MEPSRVDAVAGDAVAGAVAAATVVPGSPPLPQRTASHAVSATTTSAVVVPATTRSGTAGREPARTARHRSSRPGGSTTTGAGRGRRPGTTWVSSVRGSAPGRGTPPGVRATASGRQACRRSRAKAAAEPRSCGSGDSPRPMTSSSAGGASGASSARSGRWPCAATTSVSAGVAAFHGAMPVSAWKAAAATPKTSDAGPGALPRATAGSTYAGVTSAAAVSPMIRPTPRSVSTGRPSAVNTMLPGDRSPWTTPWACTWASAAATGAHTVTTSPGLSRPRTARRAPRLPPSSRSSTSATRVTPPRRGWCTTSTSRTRCGWSSSPSSAASRACRCGSPSTSTLTATGGPPRRGTARQTSPEPPRPSSSWTVYPGTTGGAATGSAAGMPGP